MTKTDEKYIEGIGRRKAAIARVRITPTAKASFTVNNRSRQEYFSVAEQANVAWAPFHTAGVETPFAVSARVTGGGTNAQAEAIRLGISRALIKHDPTLRGILKKAGFLKRDPRVVERKHFGLKKARRAPQWAKR